MTMDRLVNRTYSVILALLLTLALAGCRQEPLPESGDAIRFSVSDASAVSLMTKAEGDPTNRESLIATGSQVKLFGSYDKNTSTTIFNGDLLTCTVDDLDKATWSYGDPIRYWDKQYTFDFRAVFPTTADIQSGSNSSSVVVNFGTTATNGDYDLMVASAPGIKASEQMAKTDKTVSLKFLHACAAVRVLFRDENAVVPAEGDDPTYNYTLQSFKLTGLRKGGTLTYTGDSSVDEAAVSGWTLDESATDLFSWSAGTAWGVPKEYTAFGGWHYVAPQPLDGAKLVFTYKVGDEVMPVTLDLKTSAIESWDPGKAYTYKVTILAHSIDFTVSCEAWTTVDDVVIGPIG